MTRGISPPPTKRQKTTSGSQVHRASHGLPPPSPLEPLAPSSDNTMRILSWNVNGIAPFLQRPIEAFFQPVKAKNAGGGVLPASLRAFLQRHHWPSMLFLQEVKIANKDVKTQDAVRAAVNSRLQSEHMEAGGPEYEAHFVLPTDQYNARGLRGNGKVYGVCSILRKDLRDKYEISVRTVKWDHEGRISVIELVSNAVKLAIFNIYAVNGTENPYRNPSTGSIRGTRHDRKLQVHHLLMRECLDLEQVGWDILLVGDMNVASDARDGHPKLRTFPRQHVINRADFRAKLLESPSHGGESQSFKGVDIWRQMYPEERKYTYYSRGRDWGTSCDRVDYYIAGRGAWEKDYIKNCGILDSEAERGPSDHVPIWADLQLPQSE
ncbi:hypothetical protein ACN47E_004964 [Coniothyrium glycines]